MGERKKVRVSLVSLPKEKHIAQYIWRGGRRKGLLVAVKTENGYSIGWSLYNKVAEKAEKNRFSKKYAWDEAVNKARSNALFSDLPNSIVEEYNKMKKRAKKYFKEV